MTEVAFGGNGPQSNASNPSTASDMVNQGPQLFAESLKDPASNLMPPPNSSQFRVEVQRRTNASPNSNPLSQGSGKASGRNNLDEKSRWVNPEVVAPLHRATSAPLPVRPSVSFPPLSQQFTAPAHLMPAQLEKVENFLPMELARAPSSISSTLLLSSNHPPDFQPAALELSETQSITEVDGDASKDLTREHDFQSKEVERLSQGQSVPTSKGSLENKVADFLHRLHQVANVTDNHHYFILPKDSINLSLDLPCAREFAGPSMHLSIR